jgi:hypothetical protein
MLGKVSDNTYIVQVETRCVQLEAHAFRLKERIPSCKHTLLSLGFLPLWRTRRASS